MNNLPLCVLQCTIFLMPLHVTETRMFTVTPARVDDRTGNRRNGAVSWQTSTVLCNGMQVVVKYQSSSSCL